MHFDVLFRCKEAAGYAGAIFCYFQTIIRVLGLPFVLECGIAGL